MKGDYIMMMMTCNLWTPKLNHLELIKDCTYYEPDFWRLGTSFAFPDGLTLVDLYIKSLNPLFNDYILSDEDQTYQYLHNLGFDFLKSSKRKTQIEEILEPLGCKLDGCSIVSSLNTNNDYTGLILKFLQAIQSVSSIYRFYKHTTKQEFQKNIENYLLELDIPYKMNAPLCVGNKKIATADFIVGENKLIHTVSAKMPEQSLGALHRKQFNIVKHTGTFYSQVTLCAVEQLPDVQTYLDKSTVSFNFPEDKKAFKAFLLPVAS